MADPGPRQGQPVRGGEVADPDRGAEASGSVRPCPSVSGQPRRAEPLSGEDQIVVVQVGEAAWGPGDAAGRRARRRGRPPGSPGPAAR